jgi:hypothetical protein
VYGIDEHGTGTVTSLIIASHLFRATAACINELITSLKTKGIWNETVIQLGSEFNRSPTHGSGWGGSNHGFKGCASSFFSGAIQKPYVIGNIALNKGETGAYGTWGGSAATGARDLVLGNQVTSIAKMLRIQTPTPNDGALVTEDSGGIVPVVAKATVA